MYKFVTLYNLDFFFPKIRKFMFNLPQKKKVNAKLLKYDEFKKQLC